MVTISCALRYSVSGALHRHMDLDRRAGLVGAGDALGEPRIFGSGTIRGAGVLSIFIITGRLA